MDNKINYDIITGEPSSIQKDENMSIPLAVEPQEPVETLEEKIARIAKVVAKDEISKDALLK